LSRRAAGSAAPKLRRVPQDHAQTPQLWHHASDDRLAGIVLKGDARRDGEHGADVSPRERPNPKGFAGLNLMLSPCRDALPVVTKRIGRHADLLRPKSIIAADAQKTDEQIENLRQ
jgi:hypothetical protein